MEKDVLIGGATSEIELLEFKAGGNSYGVDINCIKEILAFRSDKKPTPVPNSHPFMEGIFMPRDFLIPVVNLTKSLKLEDIDTNKNEMLIVTNINDDNIAFHVDSVSGIRKVINTEIAKPGKKLSTAQKQAVIGVYTIEDKKTELLDFKNLVKEINPDIIAE